MRLYRTHKANKQLINKQRCDKERLSEVTKDSDIVIIYETTGIVSLIKRFLAGFLLFLLFLGGGAGISMGISFVIKFIK